MWIDMNRENEEQRPISQTLCGALQKEANCKCLVLSVLIYGCLAAVTWCRCANVTKIVINFSKYPIKSTKHVSPCDDGYIYIPVAFMGMLYLVYLVECYHSPIRIDLLHAESQDSVIAKLAQLKLAQPTIWWKAISYHYVRRKRQITRYRNGDNYTTTQVYYERVNTHAATSFYFYEYCGVKDISKDLILEPKIPITKISLTKGFAFSNMRSATEFEEARSRFFAEQEHRDDYMEMREGLDLGYNFNPTSLVAVFGNPWFTNSYVYWCLSALLLSWPLRIIIECNTQYADYQITKLFGVNYDTPANGEPIHTSCSQLSAPGSYMLAPSYSEALLMEPSAIGNEEPLVTEMVPSYSEALLYERAQDIVQGEIIVESASNDDNVMALVSCDCSCHTVEMENTETGSNKRPTMENVEERHQNDLNEVQECRRQQPKNCEQYEESILRNSTFGCRTGLKSVARSCSNCQKLTSTLSMNSDILPRFVGAGNCRLTGGFRQNSLEMLNVNSEEGRERGNMTRENSEPNLRTNSELLSITTQFLRTNGQSLENILENDEMEFVDLRASQIQNSDRAEALVLEDEVSASRSSSSSKQNDSGRGAIPKRIDVRSRMVVNPMAESVKKIPSSRTYFCLKSILKQNRRRYTLVTTEELQSFAKEERERRAGFSGNFEISQPGTSDGSHCSRDCCGIVNSDKLHVNWNYRGSQEENVSGPRKKQLSRENSICRRDQCLSDQKRENSRTLIFASPIQEVCPSDPFGGKNLVPSEHPPNYDEALNLPVFSRLKRSLTDREPPGHRSQYRKHHRTMSIEPEYLFSAHSDRLEASGYQNDAALSSCEELTPMQDTRIVVQNNYPLPIHQNTVLPIEDRVCSRQNESEVNSVIDFCEEFPRGKLSKLSRSLTERRANFELRKPDRTLRRSFTERVDFVCRPGYNRRTNLNMETSL